MASVVCIRWLGDVHRRSHNYSQYLEATNVGLVHRRSHNYSQYLEATNVGLVHRGSHNYSQYFEATNGPHVQSRQIPLPDLSTLPLVLYP